MARMTRTAPPLSRGGREAPRVPREEIARIAYQLFERRGRTHGKDQDDWLEAERIAVARQRNRLAR